LDHGFRSTVLQKYGRRGERALSALDEHRVKKYNDFYVVESTSREHIIDEDFCTCGDFLYRGQECWHLIAVRLARETDRFVTIDSWYQERWKKESSRPL
jgi:predicted nucleic acid-binding Zn finger protein